jgi:hypothetical protein
VFPHTFRVVHRSRKPLKLQFLQLRVSRVFEGDPWLVGGVLRGWAARHARRVDGDDTDRGPKFQSGGSPPSGAQVAPREVSSASFRVAHKERGLVTSSWRESVVHGGEGFGFSSTKDLYVGGHAAAGRGKTCLCYISSRERTCAVPVVVDWRWWGKWREMGDVSLRPWRRCALCWPLPCSCSQPCYSHASTDRCGQPLVDKMMPRRYLPSSRCDIEVRGKSCRVSGVVAKRGRP